MTSSVEPNCRAAAGSNGQRGLKKVTDMAGRWGKRQVFGQFKHGWGWQGFSSFPKKEARNMLEFSPKVLQLFCFYLCLKTQSSPTRHHHFCVINRYISFCVLEKFYTSCHRRQSRGIVGTLSGWRQPYRNKLFVGTILIKNGTISMKVGTIAVR